MLKENKKEIKKILSKDRLEGYFRRYKIVKGEDCSLLNAYVYYSWNTALSESLYASLQSLEVSLRNSIHNSANRYFNNPYWFKNKSIFDYKQLSMVSAAERTLKRQKKNVDPGRIISELNFGFWTSLFRARYEISFWRPIIKSAFPNMVPKERTRANISKKLHPIRILRNRVYHYEPIWYMELEDIHADILKIIYWISPAMNELLKPVDHFPIQNSQDKFEQIKAVITKKF